MCVTRFLLAYKLVYNDWYVLQGNPSCSIQTKVI